MKRKKKKRNETRKRLTDLGVVRMHVRGGAQTSLVHVLLPMCVVVRLMHVVSAALGGAVGGVVLVTGVVVMTAVIVAVRRGLCSRY